MQINRSVIFCSKQATANKLFSLKRLECMLTPAFGSDTEGFSLNKFSLIFDNRCTIGMGEEYMPLIPIIITMCFAMRMDAMTAMAMVWIPCGIGWGCTNRG